MPALVGFLVSAIGLPVLRNCLRGARGDLPRLAGRVARRFALVFTVLVYLSIGPCLAIPRTASTSFEMLVPLLPEGAPLGAASVIFSVAFFAVALGLAMRPNRLAQVLRSRVRAGAHCAHRRGGGLLARGATRQRPDRRGALRRGAPRARLSGRLPDHGPSRRAQLWHRHRAQHPRHGVERPGSVALEISRAGVWWPVRSCCLSTAGWATWAWSRSAAAPGAQNGAQILTAAATGHFGVAGRGHRGRHLLHRLPQRVHGAHKLAVPRTSRRTFPRLGYRAWAVGFAAFACAGLQPGLTAILAFSVPLLSALYPWPSCSWRWGSLHRACDRVPSVWRWVVAVTAVVGVLSAARDALCAGRVAAHRRASACGPGPGVGSSRAGGCRVRRGVGTSRGRGAGAPEPRVGCRRRGLLPPRRAGLLMPRLLAGLLLPLEGMYTAQYSVCALQPQGPSRKPAGQRHRQEERTTKKLYIPGMRKCTYPQGGWGTPFAHVLTCRVVGVSRSRQFLSMGRLHS